MKEEEAELIKSTVTKGEYFARLFWLQQQAFCSQETLSGIEIDKFLIVMLANLFSREKKLDLSSSSEKFL